LFHSSRYRCAVLFRTGWAFGAAIIITVLPLTESSENINQVLSGILNAVLRREPRNLAISRPDEEVNLDDAEPAKKEVEDDSGDSAGKDPEVEA
jgi:hypothetical protein